MNDIGNKHVDMDVRSNDEQEAQQLLLDHREFMENEATVSVMELFNSRAILCNALFCRLKMLLSIEYVKQPKALLTIIISIVHK